MIRAMLREVLLAGGVAAVALFLVTQADARVRASGQEFCRAVVLGTDSHTVRRLAEREERTTVQASASEIEVIFAGRLSKSRCSIVLENDRVIRTWFGAA